MNDAKPKIVVSSFFLYDKNGEAIFMKQPACPRCGFKMSGEYAGAFECYLCGFSEVPKYSERRGYYPVFFRGLWHMLYAFLRHGNPNATHKISERLDESLWKLEQFKLRKRTIR